MKIAILPILLLSSLIGFSQGKKTQIDSLAHIIASSESVSGYTKGIAGTISEEYQAFTKLAEVATTDDLTNLINQPNLVLKCYAFAALVKYDKVKATEISKLFAENNQSITFIEGCFGSRMKVYEFMKKSLTANGFPNSFTITSNFR